MAGNAKPFEGAVEADYSYGTTVGVDYYLYDAAGSPAYLTRLFDGQLPVNMSDHNYASFFYRGSFVILTFNEKVNMWRYTWQQGSIGGIRDIYRYNEANENWDKVTDLYAITEPATTGLQWIQFAHDIPAGKYKIINENSGNMQDSEWFVESCTKYLLQDEDGNIYDLSDSSYNTTTRKYDPVELNDFSTGFPKVSYIYSKVTTEEGEEFYPYEKFGKIKILTNDSGGSKTSISGIKSEFIRSANLDISKTNKILRNLSVLSDAEDIRVVLSKDGGHTWYIYFTDGNGTFRPGMTIDFDINQIPYEDLTNEQRMEYREFKNNVYASGIAKDSLDNVNWANFQTTTDNIMIGVLLSTPPTENSSASLESIKLILEA